MPEPSLVASTPSFVPRLFAPEFVEEQLPPNASLRLTLRAAYQQLLAEEIKADGSREAYLGALNHWERLTSNPHVQEIDDDLMASFRTRLMTIVGPRTVAKTWRHLRPILRRLGPRTDRNPAGKSILREIPYFAPVEVGDPEKRIARRGELNALYAACHVATWPRRGTVPAPHFWQAAVVCWFNLGPRCWELWGDDPRDELRGWFWKNISQVTLRKRDADGRPITRHRIKYFQQKGGRWLEMPLHTVVVAHLYRLRADSDPRVFPANKCRSRLYEQWQKILEEAAKVERHVTDLDPHDLRRTCQTEYDWMKLGMGDYVLGHKGRDVGGTYYRDFVAKAPKIIRALKQPPAFRRILETQPDVGSVRLGDRQQSLFTEIV